MASAAAVTRGAGLPGVAVAAPGPNITLVNQFGQRMSLSRLRGKVIILTFVDSQCTTVCPLTTVSMVEARQLPGRPGDAVQLLGVDATPRPPGWPA